MISSTNSEGSISRPSRARISSLANAVSGPRNQLLSRRLTPNNVSFTLSLGREFLTASGALEAAKILAPIESEVQTVANAIGTVRNVEDKISDIATVAGVATQISTVAGLNEQLPTVAGLAEQISAVAGLAEQIPTVVGLNEEIPTVAGLAEQIPTVAGLAEQISTVAALNEQIPTVADLNEQISAVAGVAEEIPKIAGVTEEVKTVAQMLPSMGGIPNFQIDSTDEFTPGTPLYIVGAVLCDEPNEVSHTKWWNPAHPIQLLSGVSCWTVTLAIRAEVARAREYQISYKFIARDSKGKVIEGSQKVENRILNCANYHITKTVEGKEFYLVHITLLPLKP